MNTFDKMSIIMQHLFLSMKMKKKERVISYEMLIREGDEERAWLMRPLHGWKRFWNYMRSPSDPQSVAKDI